MPSILAVSELEEVDTKTVTNELLEKILSKDNMNTAFKRVKANKGASGIDDMIVERDLQFVQYFSNDFHYYNCVTTIDFWLSIR